MNATMQGSRTGFLLAGGKSSRMGADKAFLNLGGRTLLERALAVIGSACSTVAIVGDPAKFSSYGSVIEDIYPDCGPLSGIHAALMHSSAELNLVLAVDMPFVTGNLLAFLFAVAEEPDANPKAIVTVPRTARGLQPLCAVYRRTFAPAAEQALRAGKYKIDAVFSGLAIRVIEERELSAAGFVERSFFNVNTPEEWMAAEPDSR